MIEYSYKRNEWVAMYADDCGETQVLPFDTYEQAETCAMITHYKGKCVVKSGTYEELEPYYISLLNHHLYAKIQ